MSRSAHIATVDGVQDGSPSVVAVYDKANRRVK